MHTVLDKDNVVTRYQKTKNLWSIRKEKTCTYGKHMGHYKAVMRHDWLSWLFSKKEKYQLYQATLQDAIKMRRPNDYEEI